ncbi:MAG TPA: VOC family protein [Solirubrobacter sp.]|nr:VOC family protein [Solirubrobacter sp.]
MAQRTSHAPGTFSWAELLTSDADAAKAFYARVFGWEYRDNPVGGGSVYTTALRDGLNAAALYTSEQLPHWNCYVTVASADAAAARAFELGATVQTQPFDILDVGRSATIVDPVGAELFLWEPRRHIGASIVNAPGALTWNDLITPDPAASARFYGDLFGWTTEEVPDAGGYRVIRNGERTNGGMLPLSPQIGSVPPNWIPYFGHEDVDALAAEIATLGGAVLTGPMPMFSGAIAVFADPQGAAFAVWSGRYDD